MKQNFVLRFERFIKKDPYWKKIYNTIDCKIKSDMSYSNFIRKESEISVEDALEIFEFRLFSESINIVKLSKISGKQLFNAFAKFFDEVKIRSNLVPVYRVPPPEYVKGLLINLGEGYK